jgi:serine/threonine protein phosphatase 1
MVVIGDVHGCHAELLDLFDRVALSEGDVVVSVGDLVDRGPSPAEVVAWFRQRKNALVLMGNHERKHVRSVFSYAQEITRAQLADGYTDAVAWMRGLPYFHETEHVRIVHAAMVPGVPLAEQKEEVLCGSTAGEAILEKTFPTGTWWHEHYTDEKAIVFGHHVVGPEPMVKNDRVFGIDTGACHGMALTALTVPDFKLWSVPARADHWARVKREWQVPVLAHKPWATMTFAAIREQCEALAHVDDAGVRAFLEEKRAWAAALEASHVELLVAVRAVVERLPSDDAMRAHPASSLLFQARAGRLHLETIRSRAATPERTLALATALGVTLR